jgi:hypothetical protein
MKKLLFLLCPVALLFAACDEQPVPIPDPNLNVTGRNVLVEEVTGVRCPNCPDGSRALLGLQAQHGSSRVVVISVHAAGNFSVPYSSSLYDFRSPEIQEMANYVGSLEGFPTAAINRRKLTGEATPFITPSNRWGGEVLEDLGIDPSINITLHNDFDAATRKLNIKADLLADKDWGDSLRISVLITQDSIVDAQIDGSVFMQNYVHRHLLRDVVSAPSGDPIGEPLLLGSILSRTYEVALPADWDAKHCSVVAFIHYDGENSKEVLQVTEEHVIE